jgi:hypothetical protein
VIGSRSFVVGVALLLASGCREHRPAPGPATSASAARAEAPPPPPSAEELALIAPLAAGSELEGFELREVHGVADGVLRLVCVKQKATVRLDIALADEDGPMPPAQAGKYAVFYGARNALPEDADRLAKRLAKVLATHQEAPPPRGMGKFVEKPRPGTAL